MTTDRREFLRRAAAAAGAAGLGLWPGRVDAAKNPSSKTPPREVPPRETPARDSARRRGTRPDGRDPGDERPSRSLALLILGGTSFLGPAQVEYALARGHRVTLFNRGRTNPDLFPQVEKLRGDRNGDLEALKGRSWDVVLDNSASNHAWVRLSAGLLKDAVDRYIYVSSLSAYADFRQPGMDVDAPTFTFETAGVSEDVDAARLPYGLRKALSEREAEAAFPGRTAIVRPGLIVGPRDGTDRFTYWPVRIHRGGEVLAPGMPGDPTQIIDVRDLGEWMVRLAEEGTTGRFNAVGPSRGMAELLYGIRAVTTTPATFTWVEAEFLQAQGVRPWSDLPVWVPPRDEFAGFARFDVRRSLEAGLTFRPLADTARDTLEWHFTRPEEERVSLRAGLAPEREAEVLAAWRKRQNG